MVSHLLWRNLVRYTARAPLLRRERAIWKKARGPPNTRITSLGIKFDTRKRIRSKTI